MRYNKYHNIKTEIDGIKFDSKKEADRYVQLKILQKAGIIKNLELQPKYRLQDGFEKNGVKYRPINYIADFRYFDNEKGHIRVEDVKGQKTDVYKLKKKLFEFRYPNLELEEI